MPTGPRGMACPTTVRNKLGKGKLDKGRWEKLYIWAWDFAEPCNPDVCELQELCTYKKDHRMSQDGKPYALKSTKCLMQQRYLRTVLHSIVETMQRKKNVTTEQMIRMGYQMIPLYSQLFKFKQLEYGNEDLLYATKGGLKVNPVYKEIREIIKTIEGIWNKLTTTLKDKKPAGEIGDGGYSDAMSEAMGDVIDMEEDIEELGNEDEGFGIDLENIPLISDESILDEIEPDKPKKKRKIVRKKKRKIVRRKKK